MFGHRSDGKLVRTHDGIYSLMAHVMPKRYDAMNMCEFNIDLDDLDKFIKDEQARSGHIYNYLEIITAGFIRTVFLRPEVNRFVINRRIYQRDGIYFSIVVQKSLKKGFESNETTIKLRFEGNESLDFIHNKIDEVVKANKSQEAQNSSDKLTKTISKFPFFFTALMVKFLMGLDKIGWLPKSIMDALPFHTTFFITDMRSVKTPAIYHHVYEFGSTGLFLSTGVEKLEPFRNKEGVVEFKRVMPVRFVMDERFCDGYYFATSLRMYQRILHNPKVLLDTLELPPKELSKKEQKAIAKAEKKASKEAEKAEKKAEASNK